MEGSQRREWRYLFWISPHQKNLRRPVPQWITEMDIKLTANQALNYILEASWQVLKEHQHHQLRGTYICWWVQPQTIHKKLNSRVDLEGYLHLMQSSTPAWDRVRSRKEHRPRATEMHKCEANSTTVQTYVYEWGHQTEICVQQGEA